MRFKLIEGTYKNLQVHFRVECEMRRYFNSTFKFSHWGSIYRYGSDYLWLTLLITVIAVLIIIVIDIVSGQLEKQQVIMMCILLILKCTIQWFWLCELLGYIF